MTYTCGYIIAMCIVTVLCITDLVLRLKKDSPPCKGNLEKHLNIATLFFAYGGMVLKSLELSSGKSFIIYSAFLMALFLWLLLRGIRQLPSLIVYNMNSMDIYDEISKILKEHSLNFRMKDDEVIIPCMSAKIFIIKCGEIATVSFKCSHTLPMLTQVHQEIQDHLYADASPKQGYGEIIYDIFMLLIAMLVMVYHP